ncbi:MAG: hypothetical protein HY075_16465 [Deltaproteobacteria bacterium]|nr:hypothetical protein [Deltaproteobacteria bacterium]
MHFLRRPFAFPAELDRALQRHFFGGAEPSPAALKPLARSLEQLWPQLARERGQRASKHYSGARPSAEAYAAYYLPANAMKLPLVLEEARVFGLSIGAPAGTRTRWLDVGSGPGTAYWGLAWWARCRGFDVELSGLEQSPEFVALAGALARALTAELAAGQPAPRWDVFRHGGGKGASLVDRIAASKPHVVSMMNSIGEMAPDGAERGAWIGEVAGALAAAARSDGAPRWLVVVEPGSKAATRELLELRESLRSREDARIWLPCLSARRCGALERPDDWCHEESAVEFPKWMDGLGAAAGLRKEAVLFSYLVCSFGVHPAEPAGWPGTGARVVSQRMKEKGLTQCFLCTTDGKRKARVLDSRRTAANEAFVESARGQVFADVQLDAKGDVQSFTDCGAAGEADVTVFPRPGPGRRS